LVLDLTEGVCEIYVSFRYQLPSKLAHEILLKKKSNLVFASAYRGPYLYFCIRGIFDSTGSLSLRFVEPMTRDNQLSVNQKWLS